MHSREIYHGGHGDQIAAAAWSSRRSFHLCVLCVARIKTALVFSVVHPQQRSARGGLILRGSRKHLKGKTRLLAARVKRSSNDRLVSSVKSDNFGNR
jgi:hypothetical protein